MWKEPPEKSSYEEVRLNIREIEPILSGPSMDIPPFEPAMVELKNKAGDKITMVIRPAKKEEAPLLLKYLRNFLDVDHDFYDIVGARVYAEILGWYRNRLKDPYVLLGLEDGKLIGFANGRLMNEDINISLHTMAFKRGFRVGATMYYAKCDYTFETLNQKEFWATYESYNGFKRWGLGMAQPSYRWPDVQHELGGARVYYVDYKYWKSTVKDYLEGYIGAKLQRPVPEELLKKNEKLIIPDEVTV